MKLKTMLVLLMAVAATSGFACNGGGGSADPSEACFGFCDQVDDCDEDIFAGTLCEDICDAVDDLESEVSGDCEDAIVELFECAEDQSCDELGTLEADDVSSLLTFAFDDCEDEVDEVGDECGGELDPEE
jgi:hypothetical protein